MTKIRPDGNCRLCGNYTQGVDFQWRGICAACANVLDTWTKEDLVKELARIRKEMWRMSKNKR
jgi:hypothetical protein